MSTFETLRYERDGHVARIIMNRPEKRNAENFQLIDERDAAFQEAERDRDVRVVVLGAAGSSFSAGHDLGEIGRDPHMQAIRSTVEGTVDFERRFYFDAALRIQRLSKPTIAMVQGACVAGALTTAAMCDLIVAADDARFRDPLLGFAQRPDGGQIAAASIEVFIYPWQLGIRKAKEMLFTGDWLSAAEAKECGFVNRVVPREQLEAETMALAARIAEASPSSIALVKRSFEYAQRAMGMDASYEYHFLLHQLNHAGLREGWLRPQEGTAGNRWRADSATET
jgi:enoyl-CoA hydratase